MIPHSGFSQVVRTRNYKRCHMTRSAYCDEECSITNKTALSKRKNQSTSVLQVLDMPENNYLKSIVLSGLFTLLFTQQASAASEVATGLQSFPFFGDLGDLSTGFASVRKISQQLPFLKNLSVVLPCLKKKIIEKTKLQCQG